MNAVWSASAIRHLIEIREYIGKDSETSAARVAGRILEAIELLRTHMGRERLELLAVFHGRRQWPRKF